MGAKVRCKKGYNATGDYVEFKKDGNIEKCPVSDETRCEDCKAKSFAHE